MPPGTIDPHELDGLRTLLTGVCYRMLGCPFAAQDMAQEALARAWRARARFDPSRGSLRTWVVAIATNACLDELRRRRRRALPVDLEGPAVPGSGLGDPEPDAAWVHPIPTRLLDPGDLAERRDSIRLAFVAALQRLSPLERAVLVLREVLVWSAGETAVHLGRSPVAVNSALQRARAKLSDLDPAEVAEPDAAHAELVDRYVRAFEAYDVAAITALLRRDATMSMPPFRWWLRGRDAIAAALVGSGGYCRGSRMVPTSCNGAPAFGQYVPTGAGGALEPWALVIVGVDDDGVRSILSYLRPHRLFELVGLPPTL